MTGEVYFEVERMPEKKFVVETKYGNVEVLGTKFNVIEDPETESTTVTVTEGLVRLTDIHGNSVELSAGMSGSASTEDREKNLSSKDVDILMYADSVGSERIMGVEDLPQLLIAHQIAKTTEHIIPCNVCVLELPHPFLVRNNGSAYMSRKFSLDELQ